MQLKAFDSIVDFERPYLSAWLSSISFKFPILMNRRFFYFVFYLKLLWYQRVIHSRHCLLVRQVQWKALFSSRFWRQHDSRPRILFPYLLKLRGIFWCTPWSSWSISQLFALVKHPYIECAKDIYVYITLIALSFSWIVRTVTRWSMSVITVEHCDILRTLFVSPRNR